MDGFGKCKNCNELINRLHFSVIWTPVPLVDYTGVKMVGKLKVFLDVDKMLDYKTLMCSY